MFYPDLLDPSKAPTYVLEPAESPEFCIVRFCASAPYEDVAFKIVNKQWDFNYRHGFRCSFDRGIFHLWYVISIGWLRFCLFASIQLLNNNGFVSVSSWLVLCLTASVCAGSIFSADSGAANVLASGISCMVLGSRIERALAHQDKHLNHLKFIYSFTLPSSGALFLLLVSAFFLCG